MPVYVSEAKDEKVSCGECRGGFEIRQPLSEDKLANCPKCGAPVIRVIQAPGLTHSRTDLHYRAKRAGFKCLKKVQKGEYETVY